jgi:hypothetical protein
MAKPVLLFAVGFLQEKCLQAIFRSLIDDQQIEMTCHSNEDSAAITAGGFVASHPDRYTAVVLETGSEESEKIREAYETACWRVRSFYPSREQWHVAVAIPSVQKWALIDEHIRQEYEKIRQDPSTASTPEERAKLELSNLYNLATNIGDWVAVKPFDLEALKKQSRQVRELCTFIEKSLQPKPKSEPEPITAETWF